MRRIAIEDEGLHPAGPEQNWQESIAFGWRDPVSGVGGFHRIGNEANLETANMWCGVFADNGDHFRWNVEDQPLLRKFKHGLNCGPQSMFHDGEALRFQLEGDDCDIDFIVEDMGQDPNRAHQGNELDSKIFTNHFNSNCKIRGTVTLAGKHYEVNADGWRDHSWGPRQWQSFPVNRVLMANFGPDTEMSALLQVWADGTVTKQGYLGRNGVRHAFKDFESLMVMEDDGISARSAEFTALLDNDEVVTFRIDLVGGVICKTKQRVGYDGVGECYFENKVGFGLLELNTNARRGTELPTYAMHCGLYNGLGKRSPRLGQKLFAKTLAGIR